jgi:hypothetical protein
MMIWGSLWTSIFVSTLFSILALEDFELKALNLFERTDKRQVMEDKAAKVIANLMKLNFEMLKSYKENNCTNIKLKSKFVDLQSRINRNLRATKEAKRDLDRFKLETLYFEDDMLMKFEKVRANEKEAIKKIIQTEEIYKMLFIDSNILNTKRLRKDGPKVVTKTKEVRVC